MIVTSDPMPAAWLARFGRTAAEQALDGIAGRIAAYTVPSRLIGHRLGARVDDDRIDLFLSGSHAGAACTIGLTYAMTKKTVLALMRCGRYLSTRPRRNRPATGPRAREGGWP